MKHWKVDHLPDKDIYAVIFAYTRGTDLTGYADMDNLTIELASQVPGFLGYEVVSNEVEGIFISYWESETAIAQWRADVRHQMAMQQGREKWYVRYLSQVCRVERGHEFIAG
jgi:heme-degrading monooxygenase HmoA